MELVIVFMNELHLKLMLTTAIVERDKKETP